MTILTSLVLTLIAGDYYHKKDKVTVITRQIGLSVENVKQIEYPENKLVYQIIEDLENQIPIEPQYATFKPFRFQQQSPIHRSRIREQQNRVTTRTVTKYYTGYIQQIIAVNSLGNIVVD